MEANPFDTFDAPPIPPPRPRDHDWLKAYPTQRQENPEHDWLKAYPTERPVPPGKIDASQGPPPSKLGQLGYDRPGVPEAFKKSYRGREIEQAATREVARGAGELLKAPGKARKGEPVDIDEAIALGMMISPGGVVGRRVPTGRGMKHETASGMEKPNPFDQFDDARTPAMADRGAQEGRQVPGETVAASPQQKGPLGDKEQSIRARIQQAYLAATGGKVNTRARLSDIREKLKDIDRTTLDESLKKMQLDKKAVLYPLDNRPEITDADRNAAIYFGKDPRHIMYIERLDKDLPKAEVERETSPFGVGAAPTNATAAAQVAATAPGKVNRFVLRPLENIFDRLRGAHSAKRVEVRNDMQQYKDVPQELREKTYRYGERDKEIVLTPEEEAWFDEHVQPSRDRGEALWKEVNQLKSKRGITGDLLEEIDDMKPGYMHRQTIKSARQMLGLDEVDPVTGYRPQFGGSTAPQTKPRKYFALDDGKGGRRVVYIDQGRMYLASKSYPKGVLVKERLRGDFKAKKGSRLYMNGREWRVDDALTREIEDVGGPEYVKDSITATRLSELQLTRMRDTLLAQDEARQFLIDNNLASRTNNAPGAEWWVKTSAPGLEGLYMPRRIARVVEERALKLDRTEDPFHKLNMISHWLVTTLFWNPVFHAANVGAHAVIERGWRNFNPAADVRYVRYFRDAWRDVATQNAAYQRSLKEGASLMLGPRKANRELTHMMFDGIKELQTSAQGSKLLQRLEKIAGVPPISFVRGYYRWAGDALWKMGDILTQAAIYDRAAAHPGEALKDTISRVHREIPSYRTPVEEVLPGEAGRTIGGILKHPATRSGITFVPYHENILRGLVLIGEDILQGIKHPMTKEARAGAMEAFGKIAAISSAMAVYRYGLDPIAQQIAGDDQQAKRFGPFGYLQLVMDYAEAKHLSGGAATRLFTGGFYSPSPLIEMGTNLWGNQAFSMSPIQPKDASESKREFGYQVPWDERIKAILSSAIPPVSQARDMGADLGGGVLRALGPTQFRRKTEEQQKAASAERKATPEYKDKHPRKPHSGRKFPEPSVRNESSP
jgi:hypothetical protein